MTTFERVQRVLVWRLDVLKEEVTPDTHIKEDLGADSLDTIEIIMDVEQEFMVQLENVDAEDITTVSDLVTKVESRLAK